MFLEPVCSKPVRNPSLKEICTRYWPTIYTIYHLNHTDHKVYCVWTCSRSFSVRKKSNRLLKGGTGSPTIPKETDPPGSQPEARRPHPRDKSKPEWNQIFKKATCPQPSFILDWLGSDSHLIYHPAERGAYVF